MKILSIGTDREIRNPHSDVRSRMFLYAPLVDEMHLHCTDKGVHEEEYIDSRIWIHTASSWLASFSLLAHVIRQRQIDVIVAPDPFAKAWIAMILSVIFRKKFLLSVYGGNIFDPYWKKLSLFNRFYSLVGRMVFWFAHAIQTDGIETLEVLTRKYGKKVFWKPMIPANADDLLAIARTPESMSAKPKILYVGRLIEQKNIPLLARVVYELKDVADFVIVGDGPCKGLLPLEYVRYYAYQNREEIVERFKEAQMLILTSHFEGFARVMMEAALSGIPVVTTRVSGVSGVVINESTGYVLEQGDEKGFIEAVRLLIENPQKRMLMGKEIREKARAQLSVAMMIEKQKMIYDYLLKQERK